MLNLGHYNTSTLFFFSHSVNMLVCLANLFSCMTSFSCPIEVIIDSRILWYTKGARGCPCTVAPKQTLIISPPPLLLTAGMSSLYQYGFYLFVFSACGAVHYRQTSPFWFHFLKGHCSLSCGVFTCKLKEEAFPWQPSLKSHTCSVFFFPPLIVLS